MKLCLYINAILNTVILIGVIAFSIQLRLHTNQLESNLYPDHKYQVVIKNIESSTNLNLLKDQFVEVMELSREAEIIHIGYVHNLNNAFYLLSLLVASNFGLWIYLFQKYTDSSKGKI